MAAINMLQRHCNAKHEITRIRCTLAPAHLVNYHFNHVDDFSWDKTTADKIRDAEIRSEIVARKKKFRDESQKIRREVSLVSVSGDYL